MRRALLLLAIASLLIPAQAAAFCGFYVAGADQKMFNNATQVVMMREGTKTVLSMQNNYEGPPTDFAMVIPVPVVLQKDNVKVLKAGLFDKVDKMAAPRLVEYFEQDPCYVPVKKKYAKRRSRRSKSKGAMPASKAPAKELGVTIEAEFDVGEYNVVVLSAKESNGLETWLAQESNGLETWLAQEKYNIPKGAAPALKPYIEQGLYFFVAKVDPKKVAFAGGQATLSPLRFHYESKDFFLPVRLGLLNAKGAQDLIVHILARNKRYEVANFKNVTIPTNLIVDKKVKDNFAEFYVSLFDYTLQENPGSVVTEYSWDASTCDPCPGPTLTYSDFASLGADVLAPPKPIAAPGPPGLGKRRPGKRPIRRRRRRFRRPRGGWVLTRLHARYTAAELKDDLVFKAVEPIVGGRGTPQGLEAKLSDEGAKPGSRNNFQGRYIMLHPWEGEIACANPRRGRWGRPPAGKTTKPSAVRGTAFAKRGAIELASVVDKRSVSQLKGGKLSDAIETAKPKGEAPKPDPKKAEDVKKAPDAKDAPTPTEESKKNSCAAAPTGSPAQAPSLLLLLVGFWCLRRRR